MFQMRALIYPLIAGVLALWSGAAAADDHDTVRERAMAWLTAYEDGDLESLMTHYHEDVIVALNAQPVLKGRSAVQAYFEPRLKVGTRDMDLVIERVSLFGDTAELVARYKMVLTFPQMDDPVQIMGRSVLLYRRNEAGDWVIYTDIDNADPEITEDDFPAGP